jgi:hypothetical protein
MAWIEVSYKCNHKKTEPLYGSPQERKRALSVAANHKDCPDCYKKNREVVNAGSRRQLPALSGSEKQVAWANQIRESFAKELDQQKETLGNIDNYLIQRYLSLSPEEKISQGDVVRSQLRDEIIKNEALNIMELCLQEKKAAKWWIDNQEKLVFRKYAEIALDRILLEGGVLKKGESLIPENSAAYRTLQKVTKEPAEAFFNKLIVETYGQEKPKISTHGGQRIDAGKPKGEEKTLLSARVSLEARARIEARAKKAGRKLSAEVAVILEAVK